MEDDDVIDAMLFQVCSALETTQGQISSQSPTNAAASRQQLYRSWLKKTSVCSCVAATAACLLALSQSGRLTIIDLTFWVCGAYLSTLERKIARDQPIDAQPINAQPKETKR